MKNSWYYYLNQMLLLPLMVAYVYGLYVVHHLAYRHVATGCTVAEGASDAIGIALFLAFWDTVLLLPRLLIALSWAGELVGRCTNRWYLSGLKTAEGWDKDLLGGVPVASNIYEAIYRRHNTQLVADVLERFETGTLTKGAMLKMEEAVEIGVQSIAAVAKDISPIRPLRKRKSQPQNKSNQNRGDILSITVV